MNAQTVGSYNDSWKGCVFLSRGEDKCFGCPYYGKGITRIDKMKNHVRLYCKAEKGGLGLPTTEISRPIPANEGPHSAPSLMVLPDPVEVTCMAKAG
jgi:hypothetical protein